MPSKTHVDIITKILNSWIKRAYVPRLPSTFVYTKHRQRKRKFPWFGNLRYCPFLEFRSPQSQAKRDWRYFEKSHLNCLKKFDDQNGCWGKHGRFENAHFWQWKSKNSCGIENIWFIKGVNIKQMQPTLRQDKVHAGSQLREWIKEICNFSHRPTTPSR